MQDGGQATLASGRGMGSHGVPEAAVFVPVVLRGCVLGQLCPEHLAPRTLWRLQCGSPCDRRPSASLEFLGVSEELWIPPGRWKDGSGVFIRGGKLSMWQQVAGILVMFMAHWDIWLAVPPPAL